MQITVFDGRLMFSCKLNSDLIMYSLFSLFIPVLHIDSMNGQTDLTEIRTWWLWVLPPPS